MVDGKERWADADKVFAHQLKQYEKAKNRVHDNLQKREEKFKLSVKQKPFTDNYNYKLLEDFIEYWIEPNKSGTKMRFELEKTWSLSRRLKTWKRNGFNEEPEEKPPLYKKWVPPTTSDIATPEEIRKILKR